MSETMILGQIGDVSITAFGVMVSIGALMGMVLAVCLGRKAPGINAMLSLSAFVLVGALLGARLLYCLTMLDFILVDLGGAGFIPQLWQGGYTLYGGVLGGGAGVWLYARITRQKAAPLMDLAAAGGALALVFIRAGEFFTNQGLGEYIMEESMHRFPFAVQSVYEDWQIPIFLYEALAALVITLVLVRMKGRRPSGCMAETFIILLGVTQIILESLREDEFIRFGFVRLNMLAAAFTMAPVFAKRIASMVKEQGWHPWQIIRLVLFLLGVVLVILIEFALDKSTIDNTILYFVMAAALTGMAIAMLADGRKQQR